MRAYKTCLCLSISLLLVSFGYVKCEEDQKTQDKPVKAKVQVTRTALNVARSLDPEAMETLTVRTKTGDVATLLVKKREGRVHHFPHQVQNNSSPSEHHFIPIASSTNDKIDKQESEASKRLPKLVPDPVFVRSTPVLVKGQKNDLFGSKQSRSLLKLDSDGIPVVTGVRMPDDESDKQVWRNARVINGVLTPYDKSQSKHPHRPGSTSTGNDKKKVYATYQNQGSWIKMETVPEPVNVVSNPAPNQQPSPVAPTYETWQAPKVPESQDVVAMVGAPTVQEWHQYPQEVVKVIDDSQPVLKEEDKYLRDKILEYIKSVNQQELNRHQQTRFRSFRGAKMLDQPIEVESRLLNQPSIIESLTNYGQPVMIDTRDFDQQSPREARQLGHNFEARMMNRPIDLESRNFRHPIEMESRNMEMEARSYEQPMEMEARMLQVPGASVYPTSVLYSPPSVQSDSRGVPVEEGVRTPVLQYAHPELGVQSADIESSLRTVDETPAQDNGREQAIAYFSHDIHADRSPFAFEPGFEYEEAKVNENSQRSHGDSAAQVKPKHVSSNFIVPQSTADAPGKYYGKFENEKVQYGGSYERPFWERIGDTIREHVQTSMDRMSEMTRPVMEPLVEATHKISHNLGLGSNRELTTLKEKLGVVSTPSVILPALGLVAGGAALGLGAVAVGRYLDVDMLKRSGGVAERLGEDQLEMEHKRAMAAISGLPISYGQLANATANESAAPVAVNQEAVPASETSRVKRDLSQNFDSAKNSLTTVLGGTTNNHLSGSSLWSNTPCAKKTFCNAMLSQTVDDVIVMEKKMATYLAMLNPASSAAIGQHLDDVMAAVKNRDCSAFHCRHELSDIPVPR